MRFYFNYFFGWAKKILIVVTVYFGVVSLFFYFINKDRPVINNDIVSKSREIFYSVVNDPQLNQTKNGRVLASAYRGLFCLTLGETCTNNPEDGDKNFDKSIYGYVAKGISIPFNHPPASGIYWVYTGLQNAGFIPNSYAAEGLGFGSIKPFMNLWKVFRDLSYMLIVLILIAIGFMIMFRAKINPQTVINIENSLPKIVVTLIMITFSFAIAGFLIDLMYVLIAIAINVVGARGNHYNVNEMQNYYLSNGLFQMWDNKGTLTNANLWGLSQSLFNTLPLSLTSGIRIFSYGISILVVLRYVIPNILQLAEALKISPTPGIGEIVNLIVFIVTLVLGSAITYGVIGYGYELIPFIIWALLHMTMVALYFRLFFYLFKTYLEVLFLIVFAPIILMFEAVPGKNAFSYWLKHLIANLITFPLVITIFLVGYVMMTINSSVAGGMWSPPLLGSINPNAISMMLAMGIVFLIPDLIKLVKEAMGVKELPLSIGIGTFFGGAGAAVGGGVGLLGQFGSVSLGLKAFGDIPATLAGWGKAPNVNADPKPIKPGGTSG